MNLIACEQPVRNPEGERHSIDPPGDDEVGTGRGAGKTDRADHLSRHTHLASEQFHACLQGKRQPGDRANEEELEIVPITEEKIEGEGSDKGKYYGRLPDRLLLFRGVGVQRTTAEEYL